MLFKTESYELSQFSITMEAAFGKETSKHANDNNDNNDECKGVFDAWKLLGKRWSLLILKNLNAKESIRFNELKRLISGNWIRRWNSKIKISTGVQTGR